MLDRREGVAVAAEFREKPVSVLQLPMAGTIGSLNNIIFNYFIGEFSNIHR
jgi:hypothetical protein